MPKPGDIRLDGLEHEVTPGVLEELLAIHKEDWMEEIRSQNTFFQKFDRLPEEIRRQQKRLIQRLG
jgi:GTP-dependent phosphoenolpyruvate carboxykinase